MLICVRLTSSRVNYFLFSPRGSPSGRTREEHLHPAARVPEKNGNGNTSDGSEEEQRVSWNIDNFLGIKLVIVGTVSRQTEDGFRRVLLLGRAF